MYILAVIELVYTAAVVNKFEAEKQLFSLRKLYKAIESTENVAHM